MLSRLVARLVPAIARQQRRLSEQADALAGLRQRVRELLGRLKEQERLVALATEGSEELRAHARHHRAATRRAALLGRSDRPVVVGPWCGEVGFELLYWIPFVHWLVERARVEGQRLVVVTRGGADIWYRDLASRSVEIFDLIDADVFRGHAATWKQHQISPFDRRLLSGAIAAAGLRRARLLHPQVMYRLFTSYWKEEAVLEPITAFLRYAPLPAPPAHPAAASLPAEYVAAKFYFSQSFPDTMENRTFVQRAIAAVAAQLPVVVLSTGARLDDHHDALIPAIPGIHTLRADVRDNLAAQSAVVARARGFIGTYGGFSYLAPLYGVDSLSFFSARDKLVPFHLEHAQRVYGRRPGGQFLAVDTADARALSLSFQRAPAVVEWQGSGAGIRE
jgi:hypothetical protein